MKISVVIPLYNSSKTICNVISEVKHEFNRIACEDYEFILVNDCSTDDVYSVVKQIADEDHSVKIINLAKNTGQDNALLAGYTYSTGDYIVNMDDDFQTPGYEIGKLVNKLEQDDCDVVFAKYAEQKQSSFRRFGSLINYKMAEIMAGKPKGIRSNSFFIMRRFVCDELIRYNCTKPYIYGVIYASTSKIANVVTDHRERACGKSNYSLLKLVSLWFNGFFSFTIKPLRFAMALGSLITAISAIIAIVLIVIRINNPDSPAGWTSIIIALIFFSGVQLICIGLLGEYLGRLYITSSNLPKYVIRNTINIDNPEQDNISCSKR